MLMLLYVSVTEWFKVATCKVVVRQFESDRLLKIIDTLLLPYRVMNR